MSLKPKPNRIADEQEISSGVVKIRLSEMVNLGLSFRNGGIEVSPDEIEEDLEVGVAAMLRRSCSEMIEFRRM
jgi:hypothetical protein